MANLWEHVGNVFDSDCTVIMHQANCYGVMGAGIATQVKRDYYPAFEADLAFPESIGSRSRLGKYSYAWVDGKHRVIFNLYGQHRYGRQGKYTEEGKLKEALRGALRKLYDHRSSGRSQDFRIKIGIPMFIGCGLAGGDWSVVEPMLQECADEFDFDIHLYRLN